MKQQCFLSYCWDDVESVENLEMFLGYLKTEIEKKSYGAISVFYDKKSSKTGDNLKKNEKRILSSDSVVILFSPNYTAIAEDEKSKRGVHREYSLIKEAQKSGTLAIIPILIAGTPSKSVTKEFKDNLVADFSKNPLFINKSGSRKGYKLNPIYRSSINNLISLIICETDISFRRKDYKFSGKDEAYSTLFCNTDSKNKLPKNCMYKSDAYDSIINNSGVNFLVGRKGSGKTTFFEVLEKYDPVKFDESFKILRPISVEDVREDTIYEEFQKIVVDSNLYGYGRIIECFWSIYLHLCAIYILSIEDEYYRIRDDRRVIFHKIGNKLRSRLHVDKLDSVDVKRSIFTESVELWSNFLRRGIFEYATDESLFASLDANLNIENILKEYLGKTDYKKLLHAVEQCEKKILIALDRFDTISDDFRRQIKRDLSSENAVLIADAQERAEFDKVLYRSLITCVEHLQSSPSSLMSNALFCIILPQDRVDQIKLVDRDFAKKYFLPLSWDAYELAEVVNLRFIELFGIDIKSLPLGDPFEVFDYIINEYMPSLPSHIQIEINRTKREIGLFQYLLRLTFWRPRDIIKYMAVLYDANRKNPSIDIDMETVKNLIFQVTDDIIRDEFLNEYDKVFYNLEDFIKQFSEFGMLLPTSTFIDKVYRFNFEGSMFAEGSTIVEKIVFLYQLGIFGLKFDTEYVKKKSLGNNLCFVLNEGTNPLSAAINDIVTGNKHIQICINPIFSKKYSIEYDTDELIGIFDTKYLIQNHVRKAVIKRV